MRSRPPVRRRSAPCARAGRRTPSTIAPAELLSSSRARCGSQSVTRPSSIRASKPVAVELDFMQPAVARRAAISTSVASIGSTKPGSGALPRPRPPTDRAALRSAARRHPACRRTSRSCPVFDDQPGASPAPPRRSTGRSRPIPAAPRGCPASPSERAYSSSPLISSQFSRFSRGLRAHPDQMPAALQLLAVELELEMALGEPSVRIADRRPVAPVPDEDRAAAIFALRDRALEIGRIRADGPRPRPRAASRPGRGSGRASPPSSSARRPARGGSRSAAGARRASGRRRCRSLSTRLAALRLGGRLEVALGSICFERHRSARLASRRSGLCFRLVPPGPAPLSWPTISRSAGRQRSRATPP